MPYAPQGGAAAAAGTVGNCQVSAVNYTGNNSGGGQTQEVTGVGFESDIILIYGEDGLDPSAGPRWMISSDDAYGTVMGGSDNQWNAVAQASAIAITSDGFTLIDEANANTYKYTALCFKLT